MRFETNELYHIYNRGVEKRNIFLKVGDYQRFLFILDVFNDQNSNINTTRQITKTEGSRTSFSFGLQGRDYLVEIKEFCLMPNHFHLLLKQRADSGISKFMQRIGVGYTHYFNNKYERSGVLFQGKTKSRHVDSNEYLMWLKRYIHLNPLKIAFPSIKSIRTNSAEEVVKKLNRYKWVSCDDYGQYKDELRETDLNELFSRD